MAVSAKQQLRFWGIAFAVLILVLWLLGGTLLPFLLGAAIAYFLDPLADRLQRLGLSRLAATCVIAIVGVLVLIALLVFAVPALIWQVQALVVAMPEYIANLSALLARRYPEVFGENSRILRNLSGFETMLRDSGMTVLNQVLVGSLQVLSFLVVLFVTPVVAFYLLLDWDRMVARVNAWLPREHALTIRGLAREIDVVLAGFVRGQLSVCVILGRLLRRGALGDRAAVRHPRRADRRAHLVHPLHRLDGRAAALGRHRALPVLGREALDPRHRRHLPLRPVRRGQHPRAEPDRQVGGPASGLADPRPRGLRLALRLRRAPRRGAGGGGARGGRALPRRPVSREPDVHRPRCRRPRPGLEPAASSSSSTCRRGRRSGARPSSSRRRTGSRSPSSTAGRPGPAGGSR